MCMLLVYFVICIIFFAFFLHFLFFFFFFFNDTATTEIYTLSLHDALPISGGGGRPASRMPPRCCGRRPRSEEHTSELQSPCNLVCRLLLEKKKNNITKLYANIKLTSKNEALYKRPPN